MTRLLKLACFVFLLTGTSVSYAQTEESDLRIFGYFQSSLQYWSDEKGTFPAINFDKINGRTSFTMQQLNMFLQKDLARNWRAFLNFEAINNFSTGRQWGSYDLEEAWVRYRYDERFNLKLGLQIPIFNHLNEIKNRTPVLPYVIRPLVYETSFSELITIDEYIPRRAFVQAYGFLSSGETKFDYAVYLGNSPNISSHIPFGRTAPAGVDTSKTILVGGRVGLRFNELKVGISGTFDQTNIYQGLEVFPSIGGSSDRFKERPRIRYGADLSYHVGGFSLEGEAIVVRYDDNLPNLGIDREFFYGTLGYRLTDQWFVYGGYWYLEEDDISPDFANMRLDRAVGESGVINAGVSYNLNERITFKGHFARIDFDRGLPDQNLVINSHFFQHSVAVSVFF